MTTFPPAPSMLSQEEQFTSLVPESDSSSQNAVHLGKGCHLTLESATEVVGRERHLSRMINAYNYIQRLRREKAWAPFEEIGCVWRNVQTNNLSWKSVRQGIDTNQHI